MASHTLVNTFHILDSHGVIMNLLITGVTGFVGCHFLQRLAMHAPATKVFGVARNLEKLEHCGRLYPNFVSVPLELSAAAAPSELAEKLEGRNINGVVHLASWIPAPLEDTARWESLLRSNTLSSIHLWRWIESIPPDRRPDRVLYSSSISVYGDPLLNPASEDSPTLPTAFYGLSKLGGELYGEYFARVLGVALVNLRLGFIYGPNDANPKALYHFIRKARRGEPITITTSPLVYRDYVYVEDVCRLLEQLAFGPKPPSGVINVSAGRGVTLLELATRIRRLTGTFSPIVVTPGEGDFLSGCAVQDVAKARAIIGESTDIGTGLKLTLAAGEDHE
jgi:nucleoside-diphosphate-sugar epimerase